MKEYLWDNLPPTRLIGYLTKRHCALENVLCVFDEFREIENLQRNEDSEIEELFQI